MFFESIIVSILVNNVYLIKRMTNERDIKNNLQNEISFGMQSMRAIVELIEICLDM